MIVAVYAFIDAADAGRKDVAAKWLETLPGFQVAEAFDDFCTRCPDRIELDVLRRPANALNVEWIQSAPRCRAQTPPEWKDTDPRAMRWLLSGGSALVLGHCSRSACPRAKKPVDCPCGHCKPGSGT